MQLEDYFDFQSPDDIRIKGHRIGIEFVLHEHIEHQKTPEQIAEVFETLTLEEIYATLLYYHHEHAKVLKYYSDWVSYCDKSEREYDASGRGRELKERLLKRRAERLEKQTA